MLDGILVAAREKGLLKTAGRAATRAEDSRFPKARARRDEEGLRVGRDGMLLLEAVFAADAPPGLGTLTEVETLR